MKTLFPFILLCLVSFSCSSSPEHIDLEYGSLTRFKKFNSNYVTARTVDVWKPDSYSDSINYQVLYMHDGQMLFDSTTTWNKQEWGVDETLQRLISSEKIDPTIVVAIWNAGDERWTDYFPQKPHEWLKQNLDPSLTPASLRKNVDDFFNAPIKSDAYLKFIVEELKPFIDTQFSTIPEKEATFIAGSSMGGLISMYALCEYPDIFFGAGCISTHWVGGSPMENNPIPQGFFHYLEEHLPNNKQNKIYFDYGTETLDAYYEPLQSVVDSIMIAQGWDAIHWMTQKFEGDAHDERSWNKRLEIPLLFLMEK